MLYQGRNRYAVEEAVLHCAAVSRDWHKGKTIAQMVDAVRSWHIGPPNKWSDIGYHIVVAPDGQYLFGRPLDKIGAHVAGFNQGKLGILLVEVVQIDKVRSFESYFTEYQRDAVYNIARAFALKRLRGHNDFTSKKVCPGFHVEKEFRL